MARAKILATLVVSAVLAGVSGSASGQISFGEQEYEYEPGDVLPQAVEMVRQETYWEGYSGGEAGGRRLLGYVFLTDDLVEIPGYSGKTMNTLVGIDTQGKITGVKIVRHAEPIVLIGLSEDDILRFVTQYTGLDVRDRIIISDRASPPNRPSARFASESSSPADRADAPSASQFLA